MQIRSLVNSLNRNIPFSSYFPLYKVYNTSFPFQFDRSIRDSGYKEESKFRYIAGHQIQRDVRNKYVKRSCENNFSVKSWSERQTICFSHELNLTQFETRVTFGRKHEQRTHLLLFFSILYVQRLLIISSLSSILIIHTFYEGSNWIFNQEQS